MGGGPVHQPGTAGSQGNSGGACVRRGGDGGRSSKLRESVRVTSEQLTGFGSFWRVNLGLCSPPPGNLAHARRYECRALLTRA